MSENASPDEIRDLLSRGRNVRECGCVASSLQLFLRAAHLAPDNDEGCAELDAACDQIHAMLEFAFVRLRASHDIY